MFALTGCAQGTFDNVPPYDAAIQDASTDYNATEASTIIEAAADAGFAYGSFDQSYPETDRMIYNGGFVMTAPINVYLIWYGNWSYDTNTAPIIENLMSNIGGSDWFSINALYYQKALYTIPDGGLTGYNDVGIVDSGDDAAIGPTTQVFVSNAVNYVGSINVSYTHGTNLFVSDVEGIVSDAIAANSFPLDPNGVYFVLTSKDVDQFNGEDISCDNFCGWHEETDVLNADIKIAFVGDPMACPDACTLQLAYLSKGIMNSPNGDWSADSMASIMAHELSESASDPNPFGLVAWLDDMGEESCDKCAWVFQNVYLTDTGSVANVHIGSSNYMIQANWLLDNSDPNGGHCSLHR